MHKPVVIPSRIFWGSLGVIVGTILALVAFIVYSQSKPVVFKSGNGCSSQFPVLLIESAVSTRYYFQDDQVIHRASGEIIPAQNADYSRMWIVRTVGDRYICISEEFFQRVIAEPTEPGVPPMEFPETSV